MSNERAEKDTIAFIVKDNIAWVSFNRPEKRNCMSPKLNRRMMEVLDELEFRDDVGVLVLRGEGTAWSAGRTSITALPGRSIERIARATAGPVLRPTASGITCPGSSDGSASCTSATWSAETTT